MRDLIMAGAAGLFLAFGAMGAANALGNPPHYATALPACFSRSSPILDNHYGYDDRICHPKMTEGRAAFVDQESSHGQ